MKQELDPSLSKRPIKALDELDLIAAEKAAIVLRGEIQSDKQLIEAWSNETGQVIQRDLLRQQKELEREHMLIPVTETVKLAINQGKWKQLDILISRHIIKNNEVVRKEGLVASIVRRTSEIAARLKKKSVTQEA